MKKIGLCVLLSSLVINLFAQKNQINVTTELNKLWNVQHLPVYFEGTAEREVSSYDTTGNNDDGFSGKYSFIRKNPDSTLVIFEASGNGVINRIWTPTPTDDTLDFYLGDMVNPSFSICFSDLFSGKVFPFIAPLTGNELGGYFCYFPIPFKDGSKIVFRGKKMQFYQIQYRSYPDTYRIENFKLDLDQSAKEELKAIPKKWNEAGKMEEKLALHKEILLAPGKAITLFDLSKGGRIVGIRFNPADAFRGLNKQIDLKITWDNERQPAVYMPIADFFGYAFGKESMQSLLLGTMNNTNYCYFPMPFKQKAKIEIIYRLSNEVKSEPVKIKADIFVSDKKYDPAKEGKFYAFWNPDINVSLGKPHVFLEGKGKGHYVGTILQAQGLNPGMTTFFEGDDITTIDGEMMMHGTGSEDYFNGGWYALLDRWDRKMSLPLHGALDYSLPYARTGGYRLFIPDKMPFEKEISHTIEHGPEKNNVPADYTSVALYYAPKKITSTRPEVKPNNSLTKVFIPDTFMLYPQLMQFSIAGAVKIDGNLMQSATGGLVQINLSDLPKGSYKLYADLQKTPDGGEIVVWQRQKEVSDPISFYAEKKETLTAKYICDINIDDFKNAITFRFKKDAMKSVIHIQRLILIRKKI